MSPPGPRLYNYRRARRSGDDHFSDFGTATPAHLLAHPPGPGALTGRGPAGVIIDPTFREFATITARLTLDSKIRYPHDGGGNSADVFWDSNPTRLYTSFFLSETQRHELHPQVQDPIEGFLSLGRIHSRLHYLSQSRLRISDCVIIVEAVQVRGRSLRIEHQRTVLLFQLEV